MKKNKLVYSAVLVAALTLAGCCSCPPHPQGQCYAWGGSAWAVVNNSGYPVDVFEFGHKVASLSVGQVLPLKFALFVPDTVVTVVGHTETGQYVGTSTHRFCAQESETWTVNQLYEPQPPR